MIFDRLRNANIKLVQTSQNSPQKDPFEDAQNDFKKQLLQRHPYTIINFYYYFLPHLHKAFIGGLEESLYSSPMFVFTTLMTSGYSKAFDHLGDVVVNPQLSNKLPSLFNQEDCLTMAQAAKEIAIDFYNQVKRSAVYCKESLEAKDAAVDIIGDFLPAILKYNKGGKKAEDRKVMVEEAKKTLERYNTNKYSTFLICDNAFERAGVPNDGEKLLLSIERVLMYMDILHYSGYINFDYKKGNPETMNFEL